MSTGLKVVLLFVVFLMFGVSPVLSQDDFETKIRKQAEQVEKKKPIRSQQELKLHGILYDILQLAEESDTSEAKRQKLTDLFRNEKNYKVDKGGRIRIAAHLRSISDISNVVSIIKELGGDVERVGKHFPYVYCRINPKKLRSLISIEVITEIEDIEPGVSNVIVSAGDRELKVEDVRNQYLVAGFGQKIGVLSDGVEHLDQVSSAGELPLVTVLNPGDPSEDEGTAMLEIVHDLAPLSELYFYGYGEGFEVGAEGIRQLFLSGCKIIVDDVSYFREPWFTDEDNFMGKAIRDFVQAGGVYISSCGNWNYEPFPNPLNPQLFSSITYFDTDGFHRFPNGTKFLEMAVPYESSAKVKLQWANRWNNPSSDYDLYVFDETGNAEVGLGGKLPQSSNPPQEEVVNITNSTTQTKVYRIAIKYVSGGTQQTEFKIVASGILTLMNQDTDRKHITGHAGYLNVIGVAAYDSELPGIMASYSSWGDLKMYSYNLNQWTVQQTPVITATAGVHTYVGSSGLWGNPQIYDPFHGTSAAAPHIAAIAALYFSKYPTRTRDDFVHDLTSSAVSIDGSTGGTWDRRAGFGKADALACFYRTNATVATPRIDPRSGQFVESVPVTMSCATSNATIYYTLTGENPDSTSLQYRGRFNVTTSRMVKARAYNAGMPASNIDSVYYTINSSGIPVPQFSKAGGTYIGQVQFQILANYNSLNYVIFTTNGTEPIEGNLWTYVSFSERSGYTVGPGTKTYMAKQVNLDGGGYRTSGTAVATYTVLPGLRIAQVDSAGVSFGQWTRWESNQWRPYPDTIFVRPSSPTTYTLRADTNYKVGTTQKYAVWRKGTSTDFVVNHADVPVDSGSDKILANFQPSKPTTIQAQLLDGGNPGGTINFKDPWLIDAADSKGVKNRGVNAIWHSNIASPFKPETSATYKGVFLNENIQFDPTKPNYSVGAPLQQTFGTTAGVFVGWSGNADSVSFKNANSDTTGVVLKKAGATATAKYKAHLRSSSSLATAPTMQRKIIRDANGNYHMVYESAGEIWYTRSTDGGGTWFPETKLSSAADWGASAGRPSITVQANPHIILVVWEEFDGYNGRIPVAGINPLTGSVDWTVNIRNYYGASTITPVVASGVTHNGINYVLVGWYDSYYGSLMGKVRVADGNWGNEVILRTGAISQFTVTPVAVGYTQSTNYWTLIWIEQGTLYSGDVAMTINPSAVQQLTVASGQSIESPSAAQISHSTNRQPAVAWQEYDPTLARTVIKYGERVGTWSTLNVFSSPPGQPAWYYTPSLGGHYASSNVSVTFKQGIVVKYMKRLGETWSSQSTPATGIDPSASVGWTNVGSELVLTRGMTSLYAIQKNTVTLGTQYTPETATIASKSQESPPHSVEEQNSFSEGRGGIVTVPGTRLRITILTPTIDGVPIGYPTISDTLQVRNRETFESYLGTLPFSGTGTLKFWALYGAKGNPRSNSKVNLTLRDAATGGILQSIATLSGVKDTLLEFSVPLQYNSRSLQLAVGLVNAPKTVAYRLERWMVGAVDSSALPGKPALKKNEKEHTLLIPTSYAVDQNFPNPFNPSTQINYDLPEPSQVSLVIYDVLGRKVAELASGYRAAGYHSATWNVPQGGIASGVYFARFTATDASGNIKLSKISKLVLSK